MGPEVVQVDIERGETFFHTGIWPEQLAAHWHADPVGAIERMTRIIGTLFAPYVATGERMPNAGGDTAYLAHWRQAWDAVPAWPTDPKPPPQWIALVERARQNVRSWIARPGARIALAELALALQRTGCVDAERWQALWSALRFTPLRRAHPAPAVRPPIPAAPAIHGRHLELLYPQYRGGYA